MNRQEIELGCLYHLVWAFGGENVMLAVEVPRDSYLYKVEKAFLKPIAHLESGGFHSESGAIYPSWNNLRFFQKIEQSELPLYITWKHNSKFEEILNG
jgi:hypothetical protein